MSLQRQTHFSNKPQVAMKLLVLVCHLNFMLSVLCENHRLHTNNGHIQTHVTGFCVLKPDAGLRAQLSANDELLVLVLKN